MDKNQIEEFFKLVKNQLDKFNETDEITASVISTLVKNNLVEDLYNKIPEEINKLLETRDFTQALDITKKILVTYGLPEDIVNNLSIIHLVKLIKSLKYFISDKSTITLYKIIASIFDDVYLAELYITYDEQTNNVYLVPKWINDPPDNIKNQYKTLDYDQVYDKLPELLITKQEWLIQFQNNNATYPLMTNILLSVSNKSHNISIIDEIISTIIYKEYYNNSLTLYLDYKKFIVQFSDIIDIYYYIIALFNNLSILTINHPEHINTYISIDNIKFKVEDIDTIIELSKNVNTKQKSDEFKKYLQTYIKIKDQIQPHRYTIDELQSQLYIKYPELISYINSIYNASKNNNTLLTTARLNLLTQIVNSILYNYSQDKYIQTFINTYFFINNNEQTLSNELIVYYKPINVLLLNNYIDYILFTIKEPLDNQYIEDFIKSISYDISSISITNLIRYTLLLMPVIIKTNRLSINDIISLLSTTEANDDIIPRDKYNLSINSNHLTYTPLIRYQYILGIDIYKEVRYILDDISKFISIIRPNTKLKNITNKLIILLTTIKISNYNLSRYKFTNNIIKQTSPRYMINDLFFVNVI